MSNLDDLDNLKALNSIHYYLNSESAHVFVYNNSDKDPANNKKRTVLVIPMDERRAIQIPATPYPVDLSEQAPKEELVKNPFFMNILSKRLITICDDKEAFEVLSTPQAQSEIAKLNSNSKLSLDEVFNRPKIEVSASNVEAPKIENLDVDLTVMEAMNREDIQEAEQFGIIKNIEGSLERKDWEYIYEHGSEELKALAAKHLG